MTQSKQTLDHKSRETKSSESSVLNNISVVERRILVDLIRSYGDALCPRSEAKADFNRLCAGATEKTLQSILGEKSAGSFIQSLEKYASFKIQDIGDKPEFLVKCIKEVCGPSSDVIEDFIVKELKDKIQVKVK